MSATSPPPTGTPAHRDGHHTLEGWRDNTRVFLQPIAAPSILGLFGFAAATFIVAAHLAGWYGDSDSPIYLAPFAAVFGGVAQFAAGMWAYRARDGLATAMHGMWGSFWIAFGLLYLFDATGVLTIPTGEFSELAFWFFALAAITAAGMIASLAENLGLTLTLAALATGSALLGVGLLTGGGFASGWVEAGAWVLIGSAVAAFYTASAMMVESTFGRVILPLGQTRKSANVPGRIAHQPIEFELGEPGVRHGQ